VDLLPSEKIVKEAGEIVKSRSNKKGEPSFFMNDDMRKLSTPWNISQIRSSQINPNDLPAGVILDAAAGSGVQLIALTKGLRRPALGVEIDKEVAILCAANMHIASDKNDLQRTMDRVLIGDGTRAGEVMSTLSIVLCKSFLSEAICILAAHNIATSLSISTPKAGLLSPFVNAINCTPDPAAASNITPAGKSFGLI
jgi:hypothetical protein